MVFNSLLQFTVAIIVFYYINPKLCSAQNNTTSDNPCDTSGRCGPFGSCYTHDFPICSCLQGFDPVNRQEWDAGNWTSGCARRVPLGCTSNNSTRDGSRGDGFLTLERMKLSGYSDRWSGPESDCEGRCLSNCSCIAYGYDTGYGCMFWTRVLIDVQRFTSGAGSELHIRVASSELGGKKSHKGIIAILVIVGFVIILACGFLYWKCVFRRRAMKAINQHVTLGTSVSIASHQEAMTRVNLEEYPVFKFEVLVNATDNFSDTNELGKGGFGPVYKGQLADGRQIAVKRLSKASTQGLQEFMNEIVLISKLQHRNLVRLLGCCVENKETLLIYEFMPNKSLDVFLFDQTQEILDWRRRANIIEGICRGLLYLHRDSRLKIIHRDLKPSNILLDNNWNPRISDFGMARIYGTQQDHVSTAKVVGTIGYMAPEYAMEGRFSEKSDVFSFGIMILEITTGRKNTSFIHNGGSLNLLGHVWKLRNEGNIEVLIDSRISSPNYRSEVLRCIHIGLLCVQELPRDRPSISGVLSMLNSEIMELSEPKEPAFSVKSSRSNTGTGTGSSQSTEKNTCSSNNLTITLVDGR